jgi:Transposase
MKRQLTARTTGFGTVQVDEQGHRLARRRLPEGLDGVTRLHALIAGVMPSEWADLAASDAAARVKIGIETDRGPWVTSLVAAGYEVFAINPMSTARYRERHSTSRAKSDPGDAHVLAEIVRLDRSHHRPVAGDSDGGEAMKLVARSHQTMIWDRTRHVLRLRSAARGGRDPARQPVPRVRRAHRDRRRRLTQLGRSGHRQTRPVPGRRG